MKEKTYEIHTHSEQVFSEEKLCFTFGPFTIFVNKLITYLCQNQYCSFNILRFSKALINPHSLLKCLKDM